MAFLKFQHYAQVKSVFAHNPLYFLLFIVLLKKSSTSQFCADTNLSDVISSLSPLGRSDLVPHSSIALSHGRTIFPASFLKVIAHITQLAGLHSWITAMSAVADGKPPSSSIPDIVLDEVLAVCATFGIVLDSKHRKVFLEHFIFPPHFVSNLLTFIVSLC